MFEGSFGGKPVRYVVFAAAQLYAQGVAENLYGSLQLGTKHDDPVPMAGPEELRKSCGFAQGARTSQWPIGGIGGAADDAIEELVVCRGAAPVSLMLRQKSSGRVVTCSLPATFTQ